MSAKGRFNVMGEGLVRSAKERFNVVGKDWLGLQRGGLMLWGRTG